MDWGVVNEKSGGAVGSGQDGVMKMGTEAALRLCPGVRWGGGLFWSVGRGTEWGVAC